MLPVLAAISGTEEAFEVCAGIEYLRILDTNGECADVQIGESFVDSLPGVSPIHTFVYALTTGDIQHIGLLRI